MTDAGTKSRGPRFARALVRGVPVYGRLDDDARLLTPLSRPPWEGAPEPVAPPVPVGDLTLLAPVAPSKIVAVGRNYRAHAEELGNAMPAEPLLFLKPPSAVVGPGDAIELPGMSAQVEHEGELAVVIGRIARRVAEADAMAYVFGLTCANDVTARDLQKRDGQWSRAKGFDTFCPLGPFVAAGLDPSERTVTTRVNGDVRQRGHTSALAFSIPFLVAYVSRVMTLLPGDILLTGTPAGVSRLAPGDQVEVEIDGIGLLANPVKEETGPTED